MTTLSKSKTTLTLGQGRSLATLLRLKRQGRERLFLSANSRATWSEKLHLIFDDRVFQKKRAFKIKTKKIPTLELCAPSPHTPNLLTPQTSSAPLSGSTPIQPNLTPP